MRNGIIVVIGLLIGISIFVLIKNSRNQSQPTVSSTSQNQTIPLPTLDTKFSTYNDESGIAFQYPHGILANKKDVSSDNLLYSSVILTATGSSETITMTAEQSNLVTVDDWFKGNKKASVFGEIKKLKLADLDARQFESNNAKTTIAIDQGVLFTISTNAKKDTVVAKAYEKVIGSFTFIQPTQSVQDSSSDVVEEDVIE